MTRSRRCCAARSATSTSSPDRTAFDKDPQWTTALRMLDWLAGLAARKRAVARREVLEHALVVEEHARRLEGEHVYLSGPPLPYVIATTLADRT